VLPNPARARSEVEKQNQTLNLQYPTLSAIQQLSVLVSENRNVIQPFRSWDANSKRRASLTRANGMNTTTAIIFALLAVLIVVGVFFYIRGRRSEKLRKQFGPEYKRAVDQYGDQRKAEEALAEREKRVRKLDIRGLTAEEQNRFAGSWKRTQALFVDEPSRAVDEANSLVKELMQTRGYPVGDFEQRAADVSVDHPNVVTNYRAARDIAERNKSGKASTEDLRQAMVRYRSLFEELLEAPAVSTQSPATQPESKEVAR
jgi:hypothetical protein